ncbi:hypothetical protein [Pseudovibrio sp. SPO723]|uniref:hypothetical protein n=1 Tax=Nesiotobacter zosterae TaxID=392721 RepID=UPI0029C5297D|nr:hypothetical protein [Pseudovibrio sp. SPO723]MDX5595717.1 hypothetical protein [Pseudovibrio sp. SPO723]
MAVFIAVDVFGTDVFYGYFSELDFGFPSIVEQAQALRACGLSESANKYEYAANLAWLMYFILLPFSFLAYYLSRSFHNYSIVGRKHHILIYPVSILFGCAMIYMVSFSCVDGNLSQAGFRVGWLFYYYYFLGICVLFLLSTFVPAYSCWLISKALGYSRDK